MGAQAAPSAPSRWRITLTATALTAERLHAAHRRWPAHVWDQDGLSRWRTWGERHYAYFLAAAALVGIAYLDVNLLAARGGAWWPSSLLHQSTAGLGVLAALMVVNGLVLNAYLSARGAAFHRLPAELRLARIILGVLPIFGLSLIPLTGRERSISGQAGEHPPFAPSGALPLAPICWMLRLDAWLRFAVCSASRSLPALTAWLMALQIVPYLALLSWLVSASPGSPATRLVALAVSVALHGLLFAATRRHIATLGRAAAGGWMGVALRAGPFLLLLPAPAALLGIVSWLPWARENRDEKTLIHASFVRRGRVDLRGRLGVLQRAWPVVEPPATATREASPGAPGRLAQAGAEAPRLFGELQRWLRDERFRGWWGRVGTEGYRKLAFYRLKTFLLALEAAALAWGLAWVRGGRTALSVEDSSRALVPFVALMALGAVIEVAFLGRRVLSLLTLRQEPGYLPAGRFLVAGQVALLTGLLVGSALASGHAAGVGLALMGLGIVTCVLLLLVVGPVSLLLALPGREVVAPLAWGALLFEVFVLGAVLHYQPQAGEPLMRLVTRAVALAPLLGLALGLGLGRALIAPHSWREILDPRLPGAARARLALAAVCAFLPLGGLTIPLWIGLQSRLNKAPKPAPPPPDSGTVARQQGPSEAYSSSPSSSSSSSPSRRWRSRFSRACCSDGPWSRTSSWCWMNLKKLVW
jgi:hypothetical protein